MSLLHLPQELLLRVSTYLTTPELGNLRRSCKHVETVLFESFAREFFTKRQFMVEHVSLQALLDISNHPAFSKRLTEVIISTDSFLVGNTIDDHMENRYNHGQVSRTVLIETGQARDMLTEAFSKLPNLRTVGIRDYNATGRFRDGERALWRSYGWTWYRYDLTPEDAFTNGRFPGLGVMSTQPPENVFPLVIHALGLANANPQNIDVFLRRYHKLTPMAFELVDGPGAAAVLPVLNRLKRLMLALSVEANQSDTPDAEHHIRDSQSLKRFLTATPSLETLRLNFETKQFFAHHFLQWLGTAAPSSEPKFLDRPYMIADPVPLSNLTTLDLGMVNLPVSTLLAVIKKFDLISLNLWKVSLFCKDDEEYTADPNHWTVLFNILAKTLPASTRLKWVMVGFPDLVSQYPTNGLALPLHGILTSSPVRFSSRPGPGLEEPIEDKVTFKGEFGSDVKKWLRDMAERAKNVRSVRNDSEDDSDDEEFDEDELIDDDAEDEFDEVGSIDSADDVINYLSAVAQVLQQDDDEDGDSA